jgi:SAM-dependent methyltransferase
MNEVSELYALRFSAKDQDRREAAWEALCSAFFQRFVPPEGTVVDVGAGDGLFIRHIRARRRIAVDASERVRALAAEGVEVRVARAEAFATGLEAQADLVFLSNLLEHLPTRSLVVDVLRECRRALRPAGRLVVLQPNVRYVGAAYWDYLDHEIPLTDRSVAEALRLAGLEVLEQRPRFLPYTATSFRRLPPGWVGPLVHLYLRIPPLWHLFGAQSLLVARPAGSPG